MRKAISKILQLAAQYIAPNYIAGEEVNDAIRICRQIDRHGWRSTICRWNDSSETPEVVALSYREALNAIKSEPLDCYLSIKVPSLKYDFEILKELLDLASEHNTRIHFDAQEHDTASPSFSLLERAVKRYGNISCTIPARWRRSISDAERAIDLSVAVRAVKGQFPDPNKPDPNLGACFLDLIDVLAGRAAKVAVATHDVALARKSLIVLQKSGTPCELEQLFGLPICGDTVAKPLNIKMRLYIPYGYAYLPYAISEAKKHPVILARVLKDLVIGKRRRLKALTLAL